MARSMTVVRNATAQADTGQTDVVSVPGFADRATVYLNVTATAGTTPLTDMKFQYVNPVDNDDKVDFQWNGVTQIAGTTTGHVVVHVGHPNVDTEDDTGTIYFVKDPLPTEFAIVTTFDRTTGDETYTYTIACEFYGPS